MGRGFGALQSTHLKKSFILETQKYTRGQKSNSWFGKEIRVWFSNILFMLSCNNLLINTAPKQLEQVEYQLFNIFSYRSIIEKGLVSRTLASSFSSKWSKTCLIYGVLLNCDTRNTSCTTFKVGGNRNL